MNRARAFTYVCAGLFLLALSYHFGARRANAQTGTAPEIAVLTGSVSDGGTIPLPHYVDGTQAAESECQWIVSPQTVGSNNNLPVFLRCSTTGRTVRIYWCAQGCSNPGDCVPNPCAPQGGALAGTASYVIVATRVTGAVGTVRQSIGELKERYR